MDLLSKAPKAIQVILTAIVAVMTCALIGIGVFPWLVVIRLAGTHLGYFSEETWQEIKTQVMQGFYSIVVVVLVSSVIIYHFALG